MGRTEGSEALEPWSPGALEPWSPGALEPWKPWSPEALELF
jgi:hypothetical protein